MLSIRVFGDHLWPSFVNALKVLAGMIYHSLGAHLSEP